MNKSSGEIYPFPIFLVIFVLCLLAYSILHAAGHAIVAFLAGADIRGFALLSLPLHVSYDNQIGGFYAHFVNLAGPMFPVITAIILMLVIPKTEHVVLEASKTIFSSLIVFSLLGVMVSLLLYSLGRNSDADVIGFFAQNPEVNTLGAALICLFLIILLLILIGKKANYMLIPGLYHLLQKDPSTIKNRKKKVVLSLMVLLSFGMAGAFLFNPGNSRQLLRADLSNYPAAESELYRFDIRKDSQQFEYKIQGLNAHKFELFILTDSSKTILFYGKNITALNIDRQFVLPKGIHFLVVQNVNGSGILRLKLLKN